MAYGSTRQRLRRLLQMLSIISAREGTALTSVELAQTLGVDQRSVYRDIRALKAAGVPIEWNPRTSGYGCRGSRHQSWNDFTPEEQLAILLGLGLIESGVSGSELARHASTAEAKLLSQIPSEAAASAKVLRRALRLAIDVEQSTAEHLSQLIRAIQEKRCVRIHRDESQCFRFAPHLVEWTSEGCMTLGWSFWHRRAVAIPLSRLRAVELLDDQDEQRMESRPRKYHRIEEVAVS